MNNIWQSEYSLRAGDFDRFDRIKPSAVLDLFQDAACQHAEELGLGFDKMLELGYLWVLVRVRFAVLAVPKRYKKVIVKTWPLKPRSLSFKREYCIEDESGRVLIKGSSEWMIIDSKERRLISVPNLYPLENFCNEVMFADKSGKLRDFNTANLPLLIETGFCDIDVNAHVNNTKYADYVLNAISPQKEEELIEFQIDYRKEVLKGEKLEIFHLREDNVIIAKGVNQSGDVMFACKIVNKKAF